MCAVCVHHLLYKPLVMQPQSVCDGHRALQEGMHLERWAAFTDHDIQLPDELLMVSLPSMGGMVTFGFILSPL